MEILFFVFAVLFCVCFLLRVGVFYCFVIILICSCFFLYNKGFFYSKGLKRFYDYKFYYVKRDYLIIFILMKLFCFFNKGRCFYSVFFSLERLNVLSEKDKDIVFYFIFYYNYFFCFCSSLSSFKLTIYYLSEFIIGCAYYFSKFCVFLYFVFRVLGWFLFILVVGDCHFVGIFFYFIYTFCFLCSVFKEFFFILWLFRYFFLLFLCFCLCCLFGFFYADFLEGGLLFFTITYFEYCLWSNFLKKFFYTFLKQHTKK